MNAAVESVVAGFAPVDLNELDRCAQLLTRTDRKYLVDAETLGRVLEDIPAHVRALEIDGGRWSHYESTYYDTPAFDSFRTGATKRRGRYKARTRTYVDVGQSMIEVKTKNRRGQTVKNRRPLDPDCVDVCDAVRSFAGQISEVSPFVGALRPRLTNTYRRATLVLPDPVARVTVDADFRAVDADGSDIGLGGVFVVETKTDGAASSVDRLLWRSGCRPVKFSKYSTALAALHPELPHNRWHRILVDHFGRTPGGVDDQECRLMATAA